MNGVLGMASLLAHGALDATQKDYVETIRQSGEALLDIINDILNYSKMEAGQLTLEDTEFSVSDVIDGAVQIMRPRIFQKRLDITTLIARNVPETLNGDPGRLRQILINLIGNSVKFTETGSITIECAAGEPVGREIEIRFTITDTGIGISKDAQKGLFQVFSQADTSTTRKYGGTGLGLSICRRLTQLMGGEIAVDSTPGVGSTFRFHIRCVVADRREPPWPSARTGSAPRRAMIIGATTLPDCGIARQLREYGFQVLDNDASPGGSDVDLVVIDQQSANASKDFVHSFLAGTSGETPAIWIIARDPASMHGYDAETVDRYFEVPLRQTPLREAARAVHRLAPSRPRLQRDGPPQTLQQTAELPRASDGMASQPPATGVGTPRLSILLVEDNPVNQRVAVALLHRSGADVTIAENGRKALDALRERTFDIVLMDIHMPEMDGVTATIEIRRLPPPACSVPIIAVTANAMTGDRERYLAAGMNDYVSKPIDPPVLAAAISRLSGTDIQLGLGAEARTPPTADIFPGEIDTVFDGL